MLLSNDVFDFINCDRYSAACQKGVTFATSLYVYQSCNNLPNNLNNYSAKLVVRPEPGSIEIIVECTVENGRVEVQGDRGIIDFYISAADTAQLEPGMFVYEITITSLDDLVFRLAFGKFQILEII